MDFLIIVMLCITPNMFHLLLGLLEVSNFILSLCFHGIFVDAIHLYRIFENSFPTLPIGYSLAIPRSSLGEPCELIHRHFAQDHSM